MAPSARTVPLEPPPKPRTLASAEPTARAAAIDALRAQSLGWASLTIEEPEPLCWTVQAAKDELAETLARAGQSGLEQQAVCVAILYQLEAHLYLWLYTAGGVYSTLAKLVGSQGTIAEGVEDEDADADETIVSTWHRQSSLITQTIDLPTRALASAMASSAVTQAP